jgi:hypothetical protein
MKGDVLSDGLVDAWIADPARGGPSLENSSVTTTASRGVAAWAHRPHEAS